MTREASQTQWDEERAAIVERMRAAGGKPGVMRGAALAGKSGLELLKAMLAGELPYPPIADTLDFSLIAVEAGTATFQGTPQLEHYNPMGTVHGGWYATLLDSALGCAVQSAMPAGRAYTTVELSVNIVRAASHQTGPLRAIATVLHSGRQLATAEARIVGPDGRLYAHGTTTCLVFETGGGGAQLEQRLISTASMAERARIQPSFKNVMRRYFALLAHEHHNAHVVLRRVVRRSI